MTLSPSIPLNRPVSAKIYEKACTILPGGVNSPVRSFKGLNQNPLIASYGKGDTLIDADGYHYIDYCGSWGALIHGHAHPLINGAAIGQIERGSTFGLTTLPEAQLGGLITELVPGMEKIRFVSTGTEAAMSAIRLARGYTKRDIIVKFAGHYHGHADPFLVDSGSGMATLNLNASSAGIPQESVKNTLSLPYNDSAAVLQAFHTYGERIAALILEPIAANMGVVKPTQAFMELLRQESERYGILLIFDEVITGFRLGLEGASTFFNIIPDLICFGKIIGGGFPAAAFGGKGEIMDFLAPLGPVYQAGTLSGNPVAMAAGYQALLLCLEQNFYPNLEHKTQLITRPIRTLIKEKNLNISLNEAGSLFTLFFGVREVHSFEDAKRCDIALFNRFFQYLFTRGIYFAPSQFEANFVSAAHTEEHLLYTRDVILEFLNG